MIHFVEAMLLVVIGVLFILYVEFPGGDEDIKKVWIDETSVCFYAGDAVVNCETIWVDE